MKLFYFSWKHGVADIAIGLRGLPHKLRKWDFATSPELGANEVLVDIGCLSGFVMQNEDHIIIKTQILICIYKLFELAKWIEADVESEIRAHTDLMMLTLDNPRVN